MAGLEDIIDGEAQRLALEERFGRLRPRADGQSYKTQITYVQDRPGHDRRYALSSEKLMRETGWTPQVGFEEGLARTVEWYRQHSAWVARVRSGEYQTYYARNYENRQSELRTVMDAHRP